MSKYFNTQNLLWLALVLAMAGSLKHLASVFASVDGDVIFGWVQAISIDAGLFSLAYSIRQRKIAGKPTKFVWAGVALFSAISIYGNYAYGLLATAGELPGWMVITKPLILAASLPVLVIYLSEIVSDGKQHKAEAPKVEAPRVEEPAKVEATEKGGSVKKSQSKPQQRRQQVKALLGEGKTQTEIAELLEVHPNTVNKDVKLVRNNGVAK